jgi:hypothetical protein
MSRGMPVGFSCIPSKGSSLGDELLPHPPENRYQRVIFPTFSSSSLHHSSKIITTLLHPSTHTNQSASLSSHNSHHQSILKIPFSSQQHSSHVKMQYSIVTLVAFIASAFAAPTASTGWSIKGFTRSLSHFHRHFPSFPTSSPPHPSISADSRIPSDCRQTYVCRYNFTIETGSDSQQCTVEDGDKEVETHTFSALSCEEVSHSATLPTFHLSIFFSALPSNFLDAEKLLTQHRRTDLKLPGAGTKRTTSPSSLSSMCQPKPRLSSATTTPMPDFLLPATRTLVLTKFNTLSDSLSDLFRRQH